MFSEVEMTTLVFDSERKELVSSKQLNPVYIYIPINIRSKFQDSILNL